MIRILLYILLLALAALGLAWFADRPGSVTVNWLGYEAQTTMFTAVVMIAAAFASLFVILWLVFAVIAAPGRIARGHARRRRRKGFKAVQAGIFAAGAGDAGAAAKFAAIANKYAPNGPLTRLLRAQAAQLTGDKAGAQRIFAAMLEDEKTKLLGLRGLYMEARRENQPEAARLYLEQALALNPALPWPAPSLFDAQCREGDWSGALATLAVARQHRVMDKKTADRKRAVLLAALAIESEEKGDGRALELGLEAHRLAPDLVPAAAIAGRALSAQGATSRAARVIAETWERSPHPDLAAAYAHARPGDSPRDRLARIKTLAAITPGHPEAAIAVALAAIEAQEWDEARSSLDFLLRERPSARVCVLMARIEGGQNRDAGRVREWLARALKAPRDPAWIADGVASAEWAPLSPITRTLDAYVWAPPPERAATQDAGDRLAAELELSPIVAEPQAEAVAAAPVSGAATPPLAPAEQPALAPQPRPAEAAPAPAPKSAPSLPPDVPARHGGWEIGPPERKERPKSLPPAARPAPEGSPAEASSLAPRPRQAPPPKIFVPDRPPDDPGAAETELDDAATPLDRYRGALKNPA